MELRQTDSSDVGSGGSWQEDELFEVKHDVAKLFQASFRFGQEGRRSGALLLPWRTG